MSITIDQVRAANPIWFSPENQRFFKDKRYEVRVGQQSRKAYLVRSTYAWTDMFGAKPRLHYRINEIDQDSLVIGDLIDTEFNSIWGVKEWLADH